MTANPADCIRWLRIIWNDDKEAPPVTNLKRYVAIDEKTKKCEFFNGDPALLFEDRIILSISEYLDYLNNGREL